MPDNITKTYSKGNSGNTIGTAGAIAPPQKEEREHFSRKNFDNGNYSVFNKSLINTNVKLSMINRQT